MSRLILVSNRLPVTVRAEKGDVSVQRSAGGLATGLRGPHERSKGLWIGWPGDVSALDEAQRERLDAELAELRCVPVYLSPEEVSSYYDGFSNAVLWPLFHYLLDRIPATTQGWDMYVRVNEKFADAVVAAYQPGDLVWVHDYQLLLVPGILRQRLPGAKIGFFLHIPFPASEILRTLPWREAIVEGLLGADVIGFHTFTYRSHFASSILRILGVAASGDRVRYNGRDIKLGVFAMGIDTKAFGELAEDAGVQEEAASIRRESNSQRLLVGIDRLDYTKGIPRRLLAFERLLERRPELRGHVRLVQVAVPSRDKVESYQEVRKTVDELVGRINGVYGSVEWTPIHYVYRSLDERQVVALYRAADVMLVTPVRDGMNLVAKEFVTSRVDEDGVLVLSEFAGAAAEMGEAVQVNPYDVDGMAAGIEQALSMPEDERRLRMRALRQRIISRDVHEWARSFIETLEGAGDRASERPRLSAHDAITSLVEELRAAPRLLLFLDYDGTIVEFARAPDLAAPDRDLLKLLGALSARPGTEVHLVRGRRQATVERWFGALPIGLHAEHGFWSRIPTAGAPWEALRDADTSWKEGVRELLAVYTRSTPGSLIEEKTASIAWHYRMAEPELAAAHLEELCGALEGRIAGAGLELLRGEKVIEVRLKGTDKALVVRRVLGAIAPPLPLACAMGDDATDDDMFEALPEGSITVSVGFWPSAARYRVARPGTARGLLGRLL
jgi:trehalose 6-phosphate synthase/phosphatase